MAWAEWPSALACGTRSIHVHCSMGMVYSNTVDVCSGSNRNRKANRVDKNGVVCGEKQANSPQDKQSGQGGSEKTPSDQAQSGRGGRDPQGAQLVRLLNQNPELSLAEILGQLNRASETKRASPTSASVTTQLHKAMICAAKSPCQGLMQWLNENRKGRAEALDPRQKELIRQLRRLDSQLPQQVRPQNWLGDKQETE